MSNNMQELYCNECRKYLRFKTKPWKNGKIIIACDYCGHQHCRWVKNGVVTDVRWGIKNWWFQKAPKGTGVISNSHKSSLWEEEKLKKERINKI